MNQNFEHISTLPKSERIEALKKRMLEEKRYVSMEQALLITQSYREYPDAPRALQRAHALERALDHISIRIDPEELIVGNRTAGVRGGVVSPEAGISWVDKELETIDRRPQDAFQIRPEDIRLFREKILPFWKDKSLEDHVRARMGEELSDMGKVVKINQTDHAQGHICPDTKLWLEKGPAGLLADMERRLQAAPAEKHVFYESTVISLRAVCRFIARYASLAQQMAQSEPEPARKENLRQIADVCTALSVRAPQSFREAVQCLWFLYVCLQMESNASSFSPGRMDQYLYPYYQKDATENGLTQAQALELLESLFLKFNQIVYMRSAGSAKYFAGFPIGFNVAIGGQDEKGRDASNELSYLLLQAQSHLLLPQPNLSARLFAGSDPQFVRACVRVIGMGSGMPQIFNDEGVIPALMSKGISEKDARNYAIVGCVELTTMGNNLGWSDAAMFNLLKALELTINHGRCMLTGRQMAPDFGGLDTYQSYEELEQALARLIDYFMVRMIRACDRVDKMHAEFLPSPLLSCVIDDCAEKGVDVTAGGAHYNLSGIQVIQVANIADSLAVIKKLVYEQKSVSGEQLLHALQTDFAGQEILRQTCINKVEKYGNHVKWVDEIGNKWISYFADNLKLFRNARGGAYHAGLYTVSAHIPMGKNVGASADGRHAGDPLADGGMSAMYGRDVSGPTSLLQSVAAVNSVNGSNGTLLNMKFLPEFFETEENIDKFAAMLRAVVALHILHVQFNVVRREELLQAQKTPEQYRSLTVRVAGYTAYFTELARDLQDEIIARTTYAKL